MRVHVSGTNRLFVLETSGKLYSIVDDSQTSQLDLVVDFHEAKKVVAVVCHATCILLKAKTADGKLLVDDRTWTGFADAEEQFADNFVGQRIQPFWIETEARKLPNTNFITGGMFKAFAVRDGRLITGQQQFSGAATARMVIEALGA